MPLFDSYIMVDRSGAGVRRGNRPDAIWIAHGGRMASLPQTEYPCSRTDAERRIREIVATNVDDGRRFLVCCDFGYGYPRGFSAGLPGASGPHPHIPQNQPAQPFFTAKGSELHALRETDRRARSNTPFRLFGTGSVGSQVLTGIPRLHALRTDPSLEKISAVWPFETGWATKESWLNSGVRVLHAEIYPSVREPLTDTIKDRGQVRSMWMWVRDLDRIGRLWEQFSLPDGIRAGSSDDIRIRAEEGWILGVR